MHQGPRFLSCGTWASLQHGVWISSVSIPRVRKQKPVFLRPGYKNEHIALPLNSTYQTVKNTKFMERSYIPVFPLEEYERILWPCLQMPQ